MEFTYVAILIANFANHTYNPLIRLQLQIIQFGISDHILLAIQRTSFIFYHVTYAKETPTTLDKQRTYAIE